MTVYSYTVSDLDGNEKSLEDYKDKVLLIVNTASKCGLASQLGGLEDLYQSYQDQGFEILGFPCNQFLGQEPLEGNEIQEFCTVNYDVTFPLHEKIKVNGKEAHPLYKYLKEQTGDKMIKWNYTKFLVNRQGEVADRFAPTTKPSELKTDIETLL